MEQKPTNDKGQAHGYWVVYFYDGDLRFKGYCVNDVEYGYWELYYKNENYYAR